MGRKNPIARAALAVSTFGQSEAVNTPADIKEDKANALADSAIAVGQEAQRTAQANADKLTAEESVRQQKEKARKQTIFGGATDANLFNKSLIGASTTAAGGGSRSILGA